MAISIPTSKPGPMTALPGLVKPPVTGATPPAPKATGYDDPLLDSQARNLTKAMFDVESGTNYNKIGDAGTSRGAGQWQAATWKGHAKEVLGDENAQMTPENQNVVAQGMVRKYIKEGKNAAQIAAIWNSGSDKGWEKKKGSYTLNGQKIDYDVPRHVKKVTDRYQALKAEDMAKMPSGTQIAQAAGPEQKQSPYPDAPMDRLPQSELPQQQGQDQENLLQKALEFAFPILEKKDRSPLQTLGDVGLSALWFVPGAGVGVSAALRAAGLGIKAAKVAGVVGAGAATGYGADVSQKLSEGKTGGEALTPGFGTVVGAGTGGLLSKYGGRYTQKGVLEGMSKGNNSVLGQTKRGAEDLAESFSRNKNPGQLAAEKGINLKQHVDPETLGYNTKAKATEVRHDGTKLNETLTDALSRTPGNRKVAELEQELLAKIPRNHPERADVVKKEMQLLKQQYGDNPSIGDINEWKQRNWDLGKFDTAVPGGTRLTHRMIGNHLKTNVETLAKKGGLEGVGEMNEYIGSHFDLADQLDNIHGLKAKGGRLGHLMRDAAGSTVGATAGFFGGGPLGALAGALAGHYGSKVLGSVLQKIEASPIKSAILRRMLKEDPEIVQKILQQSMKTPEGLAKITAQLKQMGIKIFPEKVPKGPIAPVLKPKAEGKGRVQGLINVMGARAGAGI